LEVKFYRGKELNKCDKVVFEYYYSFWKIFFMFRSNNINNSNEKMTTEEIYFDTDKHEEND